MTATYPTREGVEAADPLSFDAPAFTRGPARRPVPAVSEPLLQWATGLTTTQRTIYAGWFVEAGKDGDLDDAMASAGYDTVTIKHGGGNLVQHWAVERAELFVLCDGVQTIPEMKQTEERFGVAFGWRTLDDGRAQSQFRARVLLRPLLDVGYTQPLLLSVKSTLTGDVLNALLRQYDVLDAAAAARADKGLPPLALPFYAFSLELAPGEAALRGSKGAQKEIVPPVAVLPSPISRDYLARHYIRKAWVAGVERLVAATIPWSVRESALIAADEDAPPAEVQP